MATIAIYGSGFSLPSLFAILEKILLLLFLMLVGWFCGLKRVFKLKDRMKSSLIAQTKKSDAEYLRMIFLNKLEGPK